LEKQMQKTSKNLESKLGKQMQKNSKDVESRLKNTLTSLQSSVKKSVKDTQGLRKELSTIKKSVKDTQGLRKEFSKIKSGIQHCQIGRVGCSKVYIKYPRCKDGKAGMSNTIVFDKPFSSIPTVMTATQEVYMYNGHGWVGWWAIVDQQTTKKFHLKIVMVDATFSEYAVSWIACGRI